MAISINLYLDCRFAKKDNQSEEQEFPIKVTTLLLDESGLKQYLDVLRMNDERKENNPEWAIEYDNMIKDTMEVNEVAYAYFNVSRDLSVCYSNMAHHPFHQLWNGYSPFRRCDHVDINTPDDLKDVKMTYKGKPVND